MPTPQDIQKIFAPYYNAEANIWERFSEKITVREFQKNEVIKDYQGVEKYLNIVAKGSVGLFVWNGKKDICINLLYENSFMSDYFSFLKQQPSGIKTQALEDCTLWSISYPDLNELYSRNETGLRIGKAIPEILFLRKQQDQINHKTAIMIMLRSFGKSFNCSCKNPRQPISSNKPYTKTVKSSTKGNCPC